MDERQLNDGDEPEVLEFVVSSEYLQLTYDTRADVARVLLFPDRAIACTQVLDEVRTLYLDADDQLAFIEFRDVCEGGVNFRGLPEPWELHRTFGRLAEETGWALWQLLDERPVWDQR